MLVLTFLSIVGLFFLIIKKVDSNPGIALAITAALSLLSIMVYVILGVNK